MRRILISFVTLAVALSSYAQVGDYRSDFSFGVNGGYVLSNVNFVTKVPQSYLGGMTFGVTGRYTTEKYFKSICAVVAEVNMSQIGWKERIETINNEPVYKAVGPTDSVALAYSRKMTYLQIPVMARLGWGRERKGFQFFFQIGPQFGVHLRESTDKNFEIGEPTLNQRASGVVAQDTMAVENKLDYGIAGGLGLEYSHPKLGHFLIEGRYYYGLGNIYGSSKRDYFGRSNFGNIVIKMTYLFDIVRTKNSKIK